MGIFDTLTNLAEKHPEVNEQQHATLFQSAAEMFGNSGAIFGLLKNAESNGLGHIVQSWVSTGQNQSIAPGQLQQVVGQDRIEQLASLAGIPPAIASAALTRILPIIVDKFTPQGKVPEAA